LSKVVIADAGPLIAFARLQLLDLLPRVFDRVLVTEAVLVECAGRPDFPESLPIQEAVSRQMFERCMPLDFSAYQFEVDDGEASTIAAAIECGSGVLMDDRAGRRMATHIGIPMIGTVGVLVLAKRKGLVPSVKPLLERLVASGYFLGDEIIAAALAAVGE